MRTIIRRFLITTLGVISVAGFLSAPHALAASPEDDHSSDEFPFEWRLLPAREVIVEGHEDKFRAHHWMNDGYAGGVEEFYSFKRLDKDITVKMEGKAIPNNNEYEALVEVKKKDVGFVKFDYQEFRRYYDNRGGVYYPFTGLYRDLGAPLQYGDAPKELALDIGHFGVETGIEVEGYPNLTFGYEREFRDGSKSRLTWGSAIGSVTRKITPSFADINEIVDSFEIEADHTIKGFELKGEQHWEQVRIDQTRQENTFRQYWDTPANKSIVRQQIKPESKSSDTRFNIAKWFLKEKVYASSGYRFFVLKNQEWESVLGYNEFGTPAALSHGSLNNRAENSYDSHTWVQNVTSTPFRWLSLGAKLKEEYLNRRGESTYNIKTGNPSVSTTIDRFDGSTTKFNAQRFGEAINARITAIPRTALYSELELEQSRGPLNENRVSVGGTAPTSVSENVDRETLTYIQKNVETVGIHVMPISFVDLTGHYRHYWKNNDYDDLQESPPSSATVEKSAFFDGQTIRVNEFLGRLALKLSRFFQPAFRYIHRETGYETATESEASVRTGIDSNNYIVDVTSQLLTPLFATTSFSHLDATTWTPAKEALSANTPIFESGVNTWSFSLSYSPRKTLSFINTLSYSRASNFNDFSDRGLPLGADYRMVNVESGFKFGLLKDQVSLEPKYQLYRYNANNNVDAGDYTAHVALLECKMGWG